MEWRKFWYLLSVVVVAAVSVRHYVFEYHDPYRCGATLDTGRWLALKDQNISTYPYQDWQPDGCLLRSYDGPAVADCLQADWTMLFFGDSTVRRLFWQTNMLLNKTKALGEGALFGSHMNLTFTSGDIVTHFIWDPFFNETLVKALPDYIDNLNNGVSGSRTSGHHFNNVLESHIQASTPSGKSMPKNVLAVVGGGLWYSNYVLETHAAVEAYKHAIDAVTLPFRGDAVRRSLRDSGRSRVLFMPAEPPIYEMMAWDHVEMKPEKTNPMNEYLTGLAASRNIDVLGSFTTMATQTNNSLAWELDGLHNSWELVKKQVDVILNTGCNDRVKSYPYDVTCCYSYPRVWAQTVTLMVGLAVLLIAFSAEYLAWKRERLESTLQQQLPTLRQAVVLCVVVWYCFMADRSQMFAKVSKPEPETSGIALIGSLVVLLGLLGLRRIDSKDQKVLGRHQTEEWKGLMQAFVLAYYYAGSTEDLSNYKGIRLAVSMYLFLATYGYASLFYQEDGFSLRRLLSTLVRLNLLPVLLSWTLNTPYTLYIFSGLATFWFVMTYLIMRVKSVWNESARLMLVKLCFAAMVALVLERLIEQTSQQPPDWFPMVARPWPAPLELHTSLLGILAAFLTHHGVLASNRSKLQDYTSSTSFSAMTSYAQAGMGFAAVSGLLLYGYLWQHTSIDTFNSVHAYAAAVVIVAYICLRNATSLFRAWHSITFTWLGRIGLELFVLHHHIWLAADGKGVLVTGLFGTSHSVTMTGERWVDCIVIGSVLVVAAWKSREATAVLSEATASGLLMVLRRRDAHQGAYESVADAEESRGVHDRTEEQLVGIELVDSTEGDK